MRLLRSTLNGIEPPVVVAGVADDSVQHDARIELSSIRSAVSSTDSLEISKKVVLIETARSLGLTTRTP